MSAPTSAELRSIAVLEGTDLLVDGRKYTSAELRSVAVALNGGSLTVKNAWAFTSAEVRSIAVAKPGRVRFDFVKFD